MAVSFTIWSLDHLLQRFSSNDDVVWFEVIVDEAELMDRLEQLDKLNAKLNDCLQTQFAIEKIIKLQKVITKPFHYDTILLNRFFFENLNPHANGNHPVVFGIIYQLELFLRHLVPVVQELPLVINHLTEAFQKWEW